MCTVSGKLGFHALMFVLCENSFRYFFCSFNLALSKPIPNYLSLCMCVCKLTFVKKFSLKELLRNLAKFSRWQLSHQIESKTKITG